MNSLDRLQTLGHSQVGIRARSGKRRCWSPTRGCLVSLQSLVLSWAEAGDHALPSTCLPLVRCRDRCMHAASRCVRRRFFRHSGGATQHDNNPGQHTVRLERRIDCRRINDLRDARLHPLHALARRADVPRPRQQRTDPKDPGTEREEERSLPVRLGRQRLRPPAPKWRRQRRDPGRDRARLDPVSTIRPLHAQPRGAQLARTHQPIHDRQEAYVQPNGHRPRPKFAAT